MKYKDFLKKKSQCLELKIDSSSNIEYSFLKEDLEEDTFIETCEDLNFFYDESEDFDKINEDDDLDLENLFNLENKTCRGFKLTVRKDKKFFINKDNKI